QCAHVSFHGGSCSQGVASQVVDDLDVHVAGGAVDNQAWSLWGTTQGLTDAEVATSTCFATSGGDVLTDWGALCVFSVCHCLLTRLSDLATDLLASVTDALALVRIVLTKTTDVRSDLSDDLLVITGHGQLGGAIGSEGHSLWRLHDDRVGVTQSDLQVLTLLCYTVTNTEDFHLDGESFGDTNDCVVDEGT